MSDYVSDQLRAKAAALRGSISPPVLVATGWATSSLSPRVAEQAAAAQVAHKAAAEQMLAEALAKWEALRVRIPETPEGLTLRELLDEHKPYLDRSYVHLGVPACEHCDQIGGLEREGVEWPCATYEIIREGMG